jgi:hypothetical protein
MEICISDFRKSIGRTKHSIIEMKTLTMRNQYGLNNVDRSAGLAVNINYQLI